MKCYKGKVEGVMKTYSRIMNVVDGENAVKAIFPKEEYNQVRKRRGYKTKGRVSAKALRLEGA